MTQAIREGVSFYEQLQQEDGHWPGDYGGPMFLMPGLVITCYITGVLDTVLSAAHKAEMLRYLRNHQNADGGYGLHIEGASTMFGTALRWDLCISPIPMLRHACTGIGSQCKIGTPTCFSGRAHHENTAATAPMRAVVWCCSYVTMRILGASADDAVCEAARNWARPLTCQQCCA